MKKKSILKIIYILIVVVLFAICGYMLFQKYILKTVPKVFGIGSLVMVSGSMEPTIKSGEMVIIKKCKNYNVGDIVTFKYDNAFITHRITGITKSIASTKGDFNNVEDGNILVSSIEGKVIFSSMLLGKSIYILPIFIVIISFTYLLSNIKLYKKETA